MSNLIITVIAIALVAVTTLMGILYAGETFQQGREDAIATRLLSEAQQVSAAMSLATVRGRFVGNVCDGTETNCGSGQLQGLVTNNLLREIPASISGASSRSWGRTSQFLVTRVGPSTGHSEQLICLSAQRLIDPTTPTTWTPPACDDYSSAAAARAVCCVCNGPGGPGDGHVCMAAGIR